MSVLRHTIWDEDAIPVEEYKYRNLKRIVLPVLDALLMAAGVFGSIYGIPSIDMIYPPWVADIGGLGCALIAFGCLIGVAIPRASLVEIISKSALLGVMTTYVIALTLGAFHGRPQVSYLIPIIVGLMGLFVWRLSLLGVEARERRASR